MLPSLICVLTFSFATATLSTLINKDDASTLPLNKAEDDTDFISAMLMEFRVYPELNSADTVDAESKIGTNETKVPWYCKRCQKSFKRRYHFRRHVRTFHRKEKYFVCRICDKEVSRKDNLLRHIRNRHRITDATHEYVKCTKPKKGQNQAF